jgi:uncharacterized Ntn-hydrolase superfamily protein
MRHATQSVDTPAGEVYVATFSIAAVDRATGDVGVAVASKFLAAGNIVPWPLPGVGAVATQALANGTYGSQGLALMADGLSADVALARLLDGDAHSDQRQVGLASLDGSAAAHTGIRCQAWAGHRVGDGFACQGNILAGPQVIEAMAATFLTTVGALQHRLFAALAAGDAEGGDRRGRQSAALKVLRTGGGYQGLNDAVADLRVDDASRPVEELGRLLALNDLYFGKSPASEKLSLTGDILQEIAAIADRAGQPLAGSGSLDDAEFRMALEAFIGAENLEDRVDFTERTIDLPALQFLRRSHAPTMP